MKVVFVGGGSFRVVSEVRELLKHRTLMQGGRLVLVDPDRPRVEAMARVLRQAPEMAGLDVAVETPADLDEALEAADFVEVTCCPWDWRACRLSERICNEHGWIGSDNLSPNGPYLALRGGPLVLDLARRLERLAPAATMLIFTNPIAILAAVVNAGTSIRAIGICAGQSNFCFDISRMMGWPEYNFDFEVEVAGVNHLSWIKALRLYGDDFLPTLARELEAPIKLDRIRSDPIYESLCVALPRMRYGFHALGAMLYSSEGDGFAHVLHYEDTVRRSLEACRAAGPPAGADGRRGAVERFLDLARGELDDAFWTAPDGPEWRAYRHPNMATGIRILAALAGDRGDEVTASYLNRGAVRGLPDNAVVEYTLRVTEGTVGTNEHYPHSLPPATLGVTCGLLECQMLAARAILEASRHTFTQALYAYPLCRDREKVEHFMAEMLEANRPELPDWML
jgi:6-phospho-beta-glucosidase